LWHAAKAVANRVKNLKKHVYHPDYAIITDPGHNYRLLTYYISAANQVKQLTLAGFSDDVAVYDVKGDFVSDSAESAWLYYLTRKK